MLTHEQIVGYLENAPTEADAPSAEAALAADPAAAARLADFAQYDSALRSLLGGAAERARIEESVLAAIQGQSPEAGALTRGAGAPSYDFDQSGENERNTMSTKPEPAPEGHYADPVSEKTLRDQMAAQGIETSSSSTKADEVAKQLKAEEGWGQKSTPPAKPAAEEKIQEQDNDYHQGMNP